MTSGLINRFLDNLAVLSNKHNEGVVYHKKLVEQSGVSSQNVTRWLTDRGWQPVNKGSAAKIRVEKWLPPPPMTNWNEGHDRQTSNRRWLAAAQLAARERSNV